MTNIITKFLRATPKENIFVEGYLEEDFEKNEWYKYSIEESVVYVQGHTNFHNIKFEKEKFERVFIVKDFFDLSHDSLRQKYKKSKEECINLFRENLHIDDSVYINIRNGIYYLRIEINYEDAQDMTCLKISKDTLLIIDTEYSGKYYYKKNRIDSDIVSVIKSYIEYFKLLQNRWEKWYSIYEKYYEGKYIYDSEGNED